MVAHGTSLLCFRGTPDTILWYFYKAQESIPRNRFRQPMQPAGGPVRQIGLTHQPAMQATKAGRIDT